MVCLCSEYMDVGGGMEGSYTSPGGAPSMNAETAATLLEVIVGKREASGDVVEAAWADEERVVKGM